MVQSDALSRRPDYLQGEDEEETTMLPNSLFISTLDISLRDRLIAATEQDLLAKEAIESIQKTSIPPLRSAITDWTIDNELILFKQRIYVPDNLTLRQEILHLHHDLPVMGHPGVFKTLELVKRSYWWPGLYTFVKRYVHGCAICQQMKSNTHPTTPPLNPIAADKNALPFSTVSMDFITDLPESNGFDSLFVVVDHDLTKGIIIVPCHNTIDALGTMRLYHDHVYRRFGLPTRIISDRGPQFASKVFQELCKRTGIKSSMSTAYHPQTDGETERVNQEIEVYLRIYCGTHPKAWADHLTDIEFAHNQRVHSTTHQTPFYLMMGYEPRAIPALTEHSPVPSLADRKSTRLNSSHSGESRMPSSA